MYLHYFKSKQNNFGDVLNPWFWQEVCGLNFDDNQEEVFIGIGTLLNNTNKFLAKDGPKKVHIFGTGSGYGESIPFKRDNWIVHSVRGPLTAEAIGVSKSLVSSDPVIFLNRIIKQQTSKKIVCSFVPHYTSHSARFEEICINAGLNYIDPTAERDLIIAQINNSEKIICEAMHGAILAEALRVPWLPVTTSKIILSHKWVDFCQSLGLDYSPALLPTIWSKTSDQLLRIMSANIKDKICERKLVKLTDSSNFVLSKTSKLDEMNNKFEDKLGAYKSSIP